MGHDYWEERWANGQTQWQKNEINPHWQNHASHFANINKKILVPLCGQALELLWFKERSREVWGVEFVEQAIIDFLRLHQLDFEICSFEGLKLYKAGNLNLVCANIFELKKDILRSTFDLIYDRGSMAALPAALRSDYVRVLKWVLADNGEIFLNISERDGDHTEMGPPYSVPENEIVEKYGMWELEKLLAEPEDITIAELYQAGIKKSMRLLYKIKKKI